tara:strand:+ start:341 stop:676 length:336 start_codon:yes stop_codon:yes gene_type:complete
MSASGVVVSAWDVACSQAASSIKALRPVVARNRYVIEIPRPGFRIVDHDSGSGARRQQIAKATLIVAKLETGFIATQQLQGLYETPYWLSKGANHAQNQTSGSHHGWDGGD